MIEGSIEAELGASARMDLKPGGLRCEIAVPLAAATVGDSEGGG